MINISFNPSTLEDFQGALEALRTHGFAPSATIADPPSKRTTEQVNGPHVEAYLKRRGLQRVRMDAAAKAQYGEDWQGRENYAEAMNRAAGQVEQVVESNELDDDDV